MENIQRALIMAGSVLMFLIAVSVAVFSYTTITGVIDSILTSSDRNARTAEYFIEDTLDVTRYSTKAEVIMTILSMEDTDFTASEVIVDGYSFKKSSFDTIAGRDGVESNISSKVKFNNYIMSYNLSNKDKPVVIFTSVVI